VVGLIVCVSAGGMVVLFYALMGFSREGLESSLGVK
jgi:hypothetical protein